MTVMDLIKVLDDMDDVAIIRKYEDENGMCDMIEMYRGYTLRIPWSIIDMNVERITYKDNVLFIDVN